MIFLSIMIIVLTTSGNENNYCKGNRIAFSIIILCSGIIYLILMIGTCEVQCWLNTCSGFSTFVFIFQLILFIMSFFSECKYNNTIITLFEILCMMIVIHICIVLCMYWDDSSDQVYMWGFGDFDI